MTCEQIIDEITYDGDAKVTCISFKGSLLRPSRCDSPALKGHRRCH